MGFQVTPLKPDLFAFIEVDRDKAFLRHAESSLGLIARFSNLSESSCDVGGFCLFIR